MIATRSSIITNITRKICQLPVKVLNFASDDDELDASTPVELKVGAGENAERTP